MPGPPMTKDAWRVFTRRGLAIARRFKPGDLAAAQDLFQRALERAVRDDPAFLSSGEPKTLLKALGRQMWSDAGNDTQRFDPVGRSEPIDDDLFQAPDLYRAGHIPDPERLLLAKEQHELGARRYERPLERVQGDGPAPLLIDRSYEGGEAPAEAFLRCTIDQRPAGTSASISWKWSISR